MVKAQVLAGGRGKAGGIKSADDPAAAEAHASAILGMDIGGHTVRRLWIERRSDIAEEYYFSITFDRGAKRPLLMLTTAGGMEIEDVAAQTPEKIARLHVDPLTGFQPFHARRLCYGAEDPGRRDPPGRRHHDPGLPGVRRDRRHAGRDQPADRDARGRAAGARLQVHGRRQRPLQASRHRRHARHGRPRRAGADGAGARRHLRQARRHGRHPRQRRRPRDVHARRGRRRRRHAGQLPRRRRRRPGRRDRHRPRGAAVRHQGAGGALQRVRRHHPLRRGRPRHPDRARAARRHASRSSCGSTAPTTSRARCWPIAEPTAARAHARRAPRPRAPDDDGLVARGANRRLATSSVAPIR